MLTKARLDEIEFLFDTAALMDHPQADTVGEMQRAGRELIAELKRREENAADTQRLDALERWLKINHEETLVQIWMVKGFAVEVDAVNENEAGRDTTYPGESWTRGTLREAVDAAMKERGDG